MSAVLRPSRSACTRIVRTPGVPAPPSADTVTMVQVTPAGRGSETTMGGPVGRASVGGGAADSNAPAAGSSRGTDACETTVPAHLGAAEPTRSCTQPWADELRVADSEVLGRAAAPQHH